MSDTPKTKTDLLARIESAYTQIEAVISPMSEAQLTTRARPGQWAVTDHLAHLALWERGVVALLRKQDRYAAMNLSAAAVKVMGMEGMNTAIYAMYSQRPAAEVLALFRQTHADMVAVLNELSFEDLQRPYEYYSGDPASDDPRPIMGWVIGDTYEHYLDHLSGLKAV